MSFGAWSSILRQLIIPQDAGDGPRIVITSEPNILALGLPVDAALLFFWNATDYFYIAVSAVGPEFGALFVGAEAPSIGQSYIFAEYNVNTTPFSAVVHYFGGVNSDAIVSLNSDNSLGLAGSTGIDLSLQANPGSEFSLQTGGGAVPLSRGTMDDLEASTTTGIVGETVVATLTNTVGVFRTDRRYKVECYGSVFSTVANDRAIIRIREQSGSGTIRQQFSVNCIAANVSYPVNAIVMYTGRQVLGEQVVLTVARASGTGNIGHISRSAIITDITSTTL